MAKKRSLHVYRKNCIRMVHCTTRDTKRKHPQRGDCPMWRPREAEVDTGQAYKGWSVFSTVMLTLTVIDGRYGARELTVTEKSGGGG